MSRGVPSGQPAQAMLGPALMPCGAFLSPRSTSARCQACYGRRAHCTCAWTLDMPCRSGIHYARGSQKAMPTARTNRGFVDHNFNRKGP